MNPCEECQTRILRDFDAQLSALNPGERKGAKGKLLTAKTEMLLNSPCVHERGIIFLTKSRSLAGRPVFLVPVVPFEDNGHQGVMARGMNRGGAHAVYHPDRPLALVVASKTLESYYRQRRYARHIGYTEHSSTATYSSPHWWNRIAPWHLDPEPEAQP